MTEPDRPFAQPSWETAPLPPGLPPGYTPPEAGPPEATGRLVPWEDRSGNIFRAFGQTLLQVATAPTEFFDRVGEREELLRPILFGMVVMVLGELASFVHNAVFGPVFSAAMEKVMRGMLGSGAGAGAASKSMLGETSVQLGLLVFSPVIYVIGIFVGGGITHVALMIFGGAKRSFAVTIRVLAYSSAANILSILPFVGSVLAAPWAVFLHIVGLARAHRTDYGRSAAAVLVPGALACGCSLAAIALLAGMILSFAGVR